MILILTNKYDISADYVTNILHKKKYEFLRINSEDIINKKVSIELPEFTYTIQSKEKIFNINKNLNSVWFRRPGKPFEFEPLERQPEKPIMTYIENQWHIFLESLLSIDHVYWMNNPMNNHIAENKIYQLKIANKLGFKIPKSCITNDLQILNEFLKSLNKEIIAKSLYLPLIEYAEKDYFIFTNIIETINDIKKEELSLSPVIFQEYLKQKIDYRVTVVGDTCFSVRIEFKNNKIPVDWRTYKNNIRFKKTDLPSDIINKCIKLVKYFSLNFGAIDLVESKDDFYFLEINPNGEWGWLQTEANLPIAETIVQYLARGLK
ncbi:MAG: hypothetical protein ACFFDN_48050 [Candidatus Hodarchaeota archaeon]